ncbi:hypothetical protein EDD17DRAFT_1622702 [Pisolithus thermaeus]|nr:hypothetical protein EDD17DRAFT_1622702 [Pisolithus thermaeus]
MGFLSFALSFLPTARLLPMLYSQMWENSVFPLSNLSQPLTEFLVLPRFLTIYKAATPFPTPHHPSCSVHPHPAF